MTVGRAAIVFVCGLVLATGEAAAQAPAPGHGPARVEVGVGVGVSGSADLGGAAASLTPNLNGAAYTLFDARATYATPKELSLRLSYRLTRWLLLGASGGVQHGTVRVDVSGDAERAQVTGFDGEPLGQALIEGRADMLFPSLRTWGGRLVPYAMASGGWLRQWHEGNVLVENGRVLQAGAGVRIGLSARPTGWRSRAGLSAEARMTRTSGGFHWGREQRAVPSARLEFYAGWGR